MTAAGPFDDEEGQESWRVSGSGRLIWTGDTHISSQKPSRAQQEQHTKFWEVYDAHMAQGMQIVLLDKLVREDVGERRFPDVLPEYPQLVEGLPVFAVPTPLPLPLPELALTQAAAPGSTAPHGGCSSEPPRDVQLFGTPRPFISPDTPPPTAPLDAPRPFISSAAPQPFIPLATPPPTASLGTRHPFTSPFTTKASKPPNNPTPTPTPPRSNLPSSSPPTTTPPHTHNTNDWDDQSLLRLWISKVIRKKGNEPVLKLFPGHTVETLQEVWKARRPRCEELGAGWERAGRPKGPIGEWWRE